MLANGVSLSRRAREIVAAARELLEEEGPHGLSMRRVADRLGIRAPSIYKHLPDKQALEDALISAALEEQAELFERALGEPDPLGAIVAAFRRFVHEHPHLYRLMTDKPLRRDRLAPGVEARAAAPVVRATGDDPDAARALWAFAHGMTILELNGRFPPDADLDAAWARGLDAFRPPRRRGEGTASSARSQSRSTTTHATDSASRSATRARAGRSRGSPT
jgi:AcrR family transcriptional regulator